MNWAFGTVAQLPGRSCEALRKRCVSALSVVTAGLNAIDKIRKGEMLLKTLLLIVSHEKSVGKVDSKTGRQEKVLSGRVSSFCLLETCWC